MAAPKPVPIKSANPPPDPTVVRLALAEPYQGYHVTVKMGLLRRKHIRELEAATGLAQTNLMFDVIEAVARSWDLCDDVTGAPLPQPPAGADELTTQQLVAIYNALNTDLQQQAEPPKA